MTIIKSSLCSQKLSHENEVIKLQTKSSSQSDDQKKDAAFLAKDLNLHFVVASLSGGLCVWSYLIKVALLKPGLKLQPYFSGDLCVQEHQDGGGLPPHRKETACCFWEKVMRQLF